MVISIRANCQQMRQSRWVWLSRRSDIFRGLSGIVDSPLHFHKQSLRERQDGVIQFSMTPGSQATRKLRMRSARPIRAIRAEGNYRQVTTDIPIVSGVGICAQFKDLCSCCGPTVCEISLAKENRYLTLPVRE